MRLLIAVKSCCSDANRSCHKAIRDTWGKDTAALGIDLRFFVGEGILQSEGTEDVVQLAIKDDYQSLPYKTREICRYAVACGYDYVFLCDIDTYVIPSKLAQAGFQEVDYFGVIRKPIGVTYRYNAKDRQGMDHFVDPCYPWASGGVGYFLSKKAMEIVSGETPDIWAEDLWVGQILGRLERKGEIRIHDAKRFEHCVSWHFPQHQFREVYKPEKGWMQNMYSDNGRLLKVSIIIPVYNAVSTIHETIKSALNQTYKNMEIIVVDDGSVDRTLKSLEAYKYKIKIFPIENSGVSVARNYGWQQAEGGYLLFLDADDLLEPSYLARTIPMMAAGVGVVSTGMQRFGLQNEYIQPRISTFMRNDLPITSLIRREAFEEVNGFDPSIMYEDWDLWLRIIKAGWSIAMLNEPLFRYRVRQGTRNAMQTENAEKWQEQIRRRHA